MSGSAEHVVLVGGMGAGKTTVGRVLAQRLDRALQDSDHELARQDLTGKELAERQGVAALHRFEQQHVLDALADSKPSVIAAAASVVDDEEVAGRLEPVFVVWLRAQPATVAQRVAAGAGRRDLGPDPEASLAELMAERESSYQQVSDLAIDVDRRSPEQIADLILVGLRQHHGA